MGLYPKRLRGVKDLEREKASLLKEIKQLEKEDIFPGASLFGAEKEGDTKNDLAGGILNMLSGKNALADIVIGMVKGRLAKGRTRDKDEEDEGKKSGQKRPEKKEKHLLRSIAKEFIGGYLKWKAIELSYKGIKYLIRNRGENKK